MYQDSQFPRKGWFMCLWSKQTTKWCNVPLNWRLYSMCQHPALVYWGTVKKNCQIFISSPIKCRGGSLEDMVTVMAKLPGMMGSQGVCVNDCISQWQMVSVILHTLKQHNLCTHVQSVECIHMHECMHIHKHICTHRHNYKDGTFGLAHTELNIHAPCQCTYC